jgi:hypothetical protein
VNTVEYQQVLGRKIAQVAAARTVAPGQQAEPMASWIATDRAMAAAERAGNLLLAAAGAYRLASVFLDAREFGLAEQTAKTAVEALSSLAELGDPDAVSLCGGLTLLRALVAARTSHPSAAFGQLTRARQLASRLGDQRADGVPEFGRQYVALYEIAVGVDLGDAGHALRIAASVDLAALSPGRQVRLSIDLARAYALRDQVNEATEALLRAEALGLCQLRDRHRACQVIGELLAIQDAAPTGLAALAERMGTVPAA